MYEDAARERLLNFWRFDPAPQLVATGGLLLSVLAFTVACRAPSTSNATDKAEAPPPAGTIRVNETDSLEYVWIPPGIVRSGSATNDRPPDRSAKSTNSIAEGFWLGRSEVTVEAYERFCKATRRRMPQGSFESERMIYSNPITGKPERFVVFNPNWKNKDHPIVGVEWSDATAYCAWAGGRVPREEEWEYAARAGANNLRYPWGDVFSRGRANYLGTGDKDLWWHTAPVASFPANAFGLHDMVGNVAEWAADDQTAVGGVLRGGSWSNAGENAGIAMREHSTLPTAPDEHQVVVLGMGDASGSYGIRCVWAPKPNPSP
jgi:formylglycine-generating enzyme required for sulfatase activity